jgi:hypothetical protein
MDTTANEEQAQAIIDALPPEKITEMLSAKGFVVKQKTEYETEIENAKKLADSEATKRNYTTVEQSVFDATGVAKKVGEKVTDYTKRAFSELSTPKTLETTTTQSVVDANPLDLIRTLQSQLNVLQKQSEQRELDAFMGKASGLVEGAFSTIKLAVSDDNELAVAREEKKVLFEAFYEPKRTDTNQIVWMNKRTGEALIDQVGEPMKPDAIIKKNHPTWLAKEGNSQTGLGLSSKTGKVGNTWGSNIAEINENIKAEAKKRGVDATRDTDLQKAKKEAYAAIGIAL